MQKNKNKFHKDIMIPKLKFKNIKKNSVAEKLKKIQEVRME
jgi:hypothetical protein